MTTEASSSMTLCGERKLLELCVPSPRGQIQNERRRLERPEIAMGRIRLLLLQHTPQFVQRNGIAAPGQGQMRMEPALFSRYAQRRKLPFRGLRQLFERRAAFDPRPEYSRILCAG